MVFLSIPTGAMTHPGTAVKPAANTGSAADETAKIALFQTMFVGEIMTAFRKRRVTEGRVMRKTVPAGMESAYFRQVGKGSVRRHMSGQDILRDSTVGGNALMGQVDVGDLKCFLDRPTIASTMVDEWENKRNVHDMRGPVSTELGKDLADWTDGEILRLIIKAAAGSLTQTTNFIAEIPTSGTVITDATMGTNASNLLLALQQVSEAYDNADMTEGSRYVALKPVHYNLLVNNQDLLNRDFGNQNGVFSDGTVFKAWGMTLLKTTGIPTADDSANTDYINGVHGETYNANALNTIFVSWIDMAVGTAVAESMNVKSQDMLNYLANLIVASQAHGHMILYPKGCAQGKTS